LEPLIFEALERSAEEAAKAGPRHIENIHRFSFLV
jgi:hypothetical protein